MGSESFYVPSLLDTVLRASSQHSKPRGFSNPSIVRYNRVEPVTGYNMICTCGVSHAVHEPASGKESSLVKRRKVYVMVISLHHLVTQA